MTHRAAKLSDLCILGSGTWDFRGPKNPTEPALLPGFLRISTLPRILLWISRLSTEERKGSVRRE